MSQKAAQQKKSSQKAVKSGCIEITVCSLHRTELFFQIQRLVLHKSITNFIKLRCFRAVLLKKQSKIAKKKR
jgi:hypothetical protein